MLDISESCGYSIAQQIDLFNSIKPLFVAKPLVIVLSKIDIQSYAELKSEEKKMIEDLAKEANAYLIKMSNITGDGVQDVKEKACDVLLDYRLAHKSKDPKKEAGIANRLHIAQPKKRDNKDRPSFIPDSVTKGVKKTGPTVKELQDEYGGAGNFYIPAEEHYILAKEEWRYDLFPEFYNGSNVLDFYEPDIERKLDALEKEEEALLAIEAQDNELMKGEESENSDGVDMGALKKSLKDVRHKTNMSRLQHKMKAKLKARPKRVDVEKMIDHFEKVGVPVNKESLRSRSKSRRSIGDLEAAADKNANRLLADLSDDGEVIVDDKIAAEEDKTRGRKRKRDKSVNPDDYKMDVDEEAPRAKSHKPGRSMTPVQRKASVGKLRRSLTKDRREGSEPKRLPYKLVPEEQIRLAKKINKSFKNSIFKDEADRTIQVKKPKWLFAGKMDGGSRRSR